MSSVLDQFKAENYRLRFGTHLGHRLDEVPLRYLKWLVKEKVLREPRLQAYARRLLTERKGLPLHYFGPKEVVDPHEPWAEARMEALLKVGFAVWQVIHHCVHTEGHLRLLMRQAHTTSPTEAQAPSIRERSRKVLGTRLRR